MIIIKESLLAIIGLCFGGTVAAGIFAFITMLGVVPRLAARTGTADRVYQYENAIIIGGSLANIWSIYFVNLPLRTPGLLLYGLFAGIYVGCLAMALAEVLRVLPIFTLRLKLTTGLSILVAAMAVGKCAGAFYQFFY